MERFIRYLDKIKNAFNMKHISAFRSHATLQNEIRCILTYKSVIKFAEVKVSQRGSQLISPCFLQKTLNIYWARPVSEIEWVTRRAGVLPVMLPSLAHVTSVTETAAIFAWDRFPEKDEHTAIQYPARGTRSLLCAVKRNMQYCLPGL